MEQQPFNVEIEFEPADEVYDAEAEELIVDISKTGARATVLERHETDELLPLAAVIALIGVALTTVAGLAVIVVFIYRAFRCGVIIDLHHRPPRIRKDKQLPRGSLLVLYSDGREEYREGISDADVSAALRDLLRSTDAGEALADQ